MNRACRILILLIAAVFAAGVFGMGEPAFAAKKKPKKAVIVLEQTKYSLYPDDKPFYLHASTNSNGRLLYKTSNPKVVTVNKKGRVRVKGTGSARIIVSVKATKKYRAASKTVRIKVAKEQILTPEKTVYHKKCLSKDFRIRVKSNAGSEAHVRFSCRNRDVLTISKAGKVTIQGPGRALVRVSASSTRKYYAAKQTVLVIVTKNSQSISTSKASYKFGWLTPSVDMAAAASSGLPLSFASCDPNIVTVTEDGLLQPVAEGETQVIISQAGDRTYLPAEITVPVTIRHPNAKEQRAAAVAWAIEIANDNSFSYGAGKRAHRKGCYFCGTNTGPVRSIKDKSGEPHVVKDKYGKKHTYEKTYCCNPFIHAAYAHGAQNSAMLRACKRGHGVNLTAASFTEYGCWKKIGKPGFNKLIPGDVFVKKDRHVSMYVGGKNEVEAVSGGSKQTGWEANTIAVSPWAKTRYKSCTYVMRYIGEDN